MTAAIYAGIPHQRGYGIGNVFGSLMKVAVPVLQSSVKSLGKRLARQGVKTGVGLATDALRGKNMKQAAKDRMTQAAVDVLTSINRDGKRARARKRKRPVKRGRTRAAVASTSAVARKRRRTKRAPNVGPRDIFD